MIIGDFEEIGSLYVRQTSVVAIGAYPLIQ